MCAASPSDNSPYMSPDTPPIITPSPPPPAAQLSFHDVSFYWAAAEKAPADFIGAGFTIADMCINHGDFILLSGPSGAGKSSFLRLLVGFESPTTGTIHYEGSPLSAIPPTALRRQLALLPQSPIMGASSLRGALLLPFTFRAQKEQPASQNAFRFPPLPDDTHLLALLARFKLDTLKLDSPAEDLSLGQQQRVALARILLLQPRMLLVDEPTSALDADSRQCVEHCLEEVNAQGMSVLMITHTAYQPCRPVRNLLLHNGHLCAAPQQSSP